MIENDEQLKVMVVMKWIVQGYGWNEMNRSGLWALSFENRMRRKIAIQDSKSNHSRVIEDDEQLKAMNETKQTTWWEKFRSLDFSSPDQVRNMHNYPRLFLNSMHSEKITFLYFKSI